MENKIVKKLTKKSEADVIFKQQILTLKQQNMKLQNKNLAQENKILKLEQKVLHLKTENLKLQKKIDSPDGLMQMVVDAVRHNEPPEK